MYHVLLADDEPSIIQSMKNAIAWDKYGMEVTYTANSGEEALNILMTNPPDIAILDIRMPGHNGLELSKYISQNELKTQVIIVSGYAEFSYAQKAIQYNVLGYCLKPVEYDEITSLLLRAVRNLILLPLSVRIRYRLQTRFASAQVLHNMDIYSINPF